MGSKHKCGLLEIVQKKYQLPYWIFIEQSRDDTGFNAERSADGLAIGLYRSRGQEVIGFEVKRSRADWLREIRNPNKAERIARFCDKWYIVIPQYDKEIVKQEELGPWGLIVVGEKKAEYVKQAEKLEPAPVSRFFLSAIVKQAIDVVKPPPEDAGELKRHTAYRAGFEAGENSATRSAKAHAELVAEVKAFEEASGIRITSYCGGKQLGEHVRLVEQVERWPAKYLIQLAMMQASIERLSSELAKQIEALRQRQESLAAAAGEGSTA